MDWQGCRHVFKLDPDKHLPDAALEAVCESGTDALIVGGTRDVTFAKTVDLLGRIRRYAVPCALEISDADAVVPGFDHYFLPFVLNATDSDWLVKPHQRAVKQFGTMIPWENVSVLGYCVMNPDSAVARLTRSDSDLSAEDVIAYARVARHMLNIPYFYVEYSGVYPGTELIQAVGTVLQKMNGINLIYGGGIDSEARAREMSRIADTIVVGNIIYEDIEAALHTTDI